MKAQKFTTTFAAVAVFLTLATPLYAAGGAESAELPIGNFLLRVLNLCIVLGMIYYFAGAKIKGALVGRGKKIVQDMEDLEAKKKNAIAQLADVEKRIANVEAECEKLLADGRESAELLASSIIEEAEKQAKAMLDQATKSAEQAMRSEIASIRARVADEIVSEVRKGLERDLNDSKHQALIDASIAKVSSL